MSDKELKEYYAIRVQILKVKKGVFGFKDEVLGGTSYINDDDEKVISEYNRIVARFARLGVTVKNE